MNKWRQIDRLDIAVGWLHEMALDAAASGVYDSHFEPFNPSNSTSLAIQKLAGITDGPIVERPSASKHPWLEAWSDPVAGLSAFNSCIHTCNLFGDGDWRLVVADEDRKLKVTLPSYREM